jgi:hypothetical protein
MSKLPFSSFRVLATFGQIHPLSTSHLVSANGFLLENVSRSMGTQFEHCQALCSRFRQTKPPTSMFLPILGNFEHLLQFSCRFYPQTHLISPRKWFTTAQDLPLAFWTASLKFSSCICLFRHIPSFWQSPLHTHTPYRVLLWWWEVLTPSNLVFVLLY